MKEDMVVVMTAVFSFSVDQLLFKRPFHLMDIM